MPKHEDTFLLLPAYKSQHPYFWLSTADILRQVGDYATAGACYIDWTRNLLVDKFMQSDKEWSLWIDDDTMVPGDAIDKLKAHNKTFVSGLYLKKAPPHQPCAWHNDPETGSIAFLTKFKRGELVEVDGVGLGCSLIHRSVYEDIKKTHVIRHFSWRRWPVLKVREKGEVDDPMNPGYHFSYPFFFAWEDVYFCDKAKEAGVKIYLAADVECVHLDDVYALDVEKVLATDKWETRKE